ncbi:hypothetical protein GGS26DRAFT_589266 [Hypomontagnella submonticulosa]|nr:hypothetical protein GGS26DRAFT_589266 [Hypomontagnella submonticulosa]
MGKVTRFFIRCIYITFLIICYLSLTSAEPTNMTSPDQPHATDCAIYQDPVDCNSSTSLGDITRGADPMGLVGQKQESTFPSVAPRDAIPLNAAAIDMISNVVASNQGMSVTVTFDPTTSENSDAIGAGKVASGKAASGAKSKRSLADSYLHRQENYIVWAAMLLI